MTSPGPPAVAASANSFRILLFGMPGAGKSSLLGALSRAAASQEQLLNGRLTDVSHGLEELRKNLYDGLASRTTAEVMPYPVVFEPAAGADSTSTRDEQFGGVVIDCDGRVANDLLARREVLDAASPEGTLAREVLRTDVLLLVVDSSGTLPQIDADFAQFDRFMRLLEEGRGQRTEVGGLPVFLVLTKCDLLARPGDSAASWMERIEERKRDVDGLFRDFLARRAEEAGPLPFGTLDVHIWATAIRRPAAGTALTREQEPFGVAELFRQALEKAVIFRDRQRQSGRRLFWTASGAGGVAAAMLALVIGLLATNRDTPGNELRAKVEEMRFAESPAAADRLRGTPPELRRRLAEFTAVQADPAYASLSTADRNYVRDRIAELDEYVAYYERLHRVAAAADVTSSGKLQAMAAELQELTPPRDDWSQTEAARWRAERLAETDALARAVTRAKGWYEASTEKGRDLWVFARYLPTAEAPAINWRSWYDEAASLLDPARRTPFGDTEPIPSTKLAYATAQRFDEVAEARAEWEATKDKLQRVIDVSAALGLLGDAKGRPPLLVIPRPPDFPLQRARTRLNELQVTYPRFRTEFVLKGLPDAIVPSIRQAARANYEYLLEPGREAVLRQLRAGNAAGEETAARWANVAGWAAANPQELADWRELALVLARLYDAGASDPVSALAEFLQKSSFPIDIRQIALEVPFRYLDVKPQAGENLAIYHPATVGEGPAMACVPAGEGERDEARKVTVYRFRPHGNQRLTYHPGDALWATLLLRDDRALTWSRSHSTVYQFERLQRPPRLHRANEPSSDGTLAEGIELVVTPGDGIPRVPDLMPVVRPFQ